MRSCVRAVRKSVAALFSLFVFLTFSIVHFLTCSLAHFSVSHFLICSLFTSSLANFLVPHFLSCSLFTSSLANFLVSHFLSCSLFTSSLTNFLTFSISELSANRWEELSDDFGTKQTLKLLLEGHQESVLKFCIFPLHQGAILNFHALMF